MGRQIGRTFWRQVRTLLMNRVLKNMRHIVWQEERDFQVQEQ